MTEAEASFSRAFDGSRETSTFSTIWGWRLLHAGHIERAAGVFEIALNERPEDADCLYALCADLPAAGAGGRGAALLARAEAGAAGPRCSPAAGEISAQLEFYQDAAASYDRYLKLKPADEAARRERAFRAGERGNLRVRCRTLTHTCASIRATPWDFMSWLWHRRSRTAAHAIQSLDRALLLDGDLPGARFTRARC